MPGICSESTCPVCGGSFRLSWQGIHQRWPRWFAVFLLLCLGWMLWTAAGLPTIGAREIRLLFGGGAAVAWVATLPLWVFTDGGCDATQHRACLRPTWKMWLVPPLLGLGCVVGALVAGGVFYLAAWAVQWLRQVPGG